MTALPLMIQRSGPALAARSAAPQDDKPINLERLSMERAKAKGPVIEMTAHLEDGGHFVGWYPAVPGGLICAGEDFTRLARYGYRHAPTCKIGERVIPEDAIRRAVFLPMTRAEAMRAAARLLAEYGVPAKA